MDGTITETSEKTTTTDKLTFSEQWFQILNKIVDKITSGQFILTVLSGVVFKELVDLKIITPTEALVLITMVFTLYFTRDRSKG